MRLFMDFVFGLGQVLVRTLWVKSVGSAHWLVRQWVISVTELSLDLKRRQVTKIRLEPSLLLEIRTLISPSQWKQNIWKDFFCTLWLSADLVVTFFEQVLLESLEYSMSCNTQVTLDWTQGASNLGRNVYGLINHGRPAWRVCALAEGWSSKKYLFISFLGKCRFQGNKEM